uniref:Uncharacterized protein n=1 Tax=Vespula pensylvanica TaxID=30213 RepID=A0A834PBE6_VESPE|nr:hypothetical protein H0235_002665 [Vespula pensylvanica]
MTMLYDNTSTSGSLVEDIKRSLRLDLKRKISNTRKILKQQHRQERDPRLHIIFYYSTNSETKVLGHAKNKEISISKLASNMICSRLRVES